MIYFVSLQALQELGLDAGNLFNEAPSFIESTSDFVSLQALEELGLDAGNLVDEAPSFIKSTSEHGE